MDYWTLDLIVVNGVFGWGLNVCKEVKKAFAGCFDCLKGGGVLVFGWNDIPERRPFPLAVCMALSRFLPFVFPPLGASQIETRTANRHIFSLYAKPRRDGATPSGRRGVHVGVALDEET